jgi:hypothetical protein
LEKERGSEEEGELKKIIKKNKNKKLERKRNRSITDSKKL